MIFVTVGNATQTFPRLLESIQALAARGCFGDEPVIVQSGHNKDFHAVHCKVEPFYAPEQFARHIRNAAVIVCHGGAGTLHHAFLAGKVPVVMPRRRQYGEHVDDQYELVKALAQEGRIIPAYEPEDLPHAIALARERGVSPASPSPVRMLALIAEAIGEIIRLKR